MRVTKTLYVGRFTVQLNEKEIITVPLSVRKLLEDMLNSYPTTSLIVRLDMSPWDGKDVPPIYEVETTPGGLMFSFPNFPWPKVIKLADTAVCLDEEWLPAYQLLAQKTGWTLRRTWDGLGRLYFSGQPNSVPNEVRSRVITDPWCPKSNTIRITGGEVITEHTSSDFGELRNQYPTGFVVKPIWSFGSKDVYLYPTKFPFSKWACLKKDLRQVIIDARNKPGTWMIQPFFPPEREFIWNDFRIWRIYAVRTSPNQPFELIGGTWNERPSIKVHGASNTIVGEVRVSQGDTS